MGWVFWLRFMGPPEWGRRKLRAPPRLAILACWPGVGWLGWLRWLTGLAGLAVLRWAGWSVLCWTGVSQAEWAGLDMAGLGWVGECRASMRATKYEQMTICDDLIYPVHTPTLGSELDCGGLV